MAPIIRRMQAAGITTLRAIAAELNRRGISTPEGKAQWQAGKVHRLLARLA
jgi:Recombinase